MARVERYLGQRQGMEPSAGMLVFECLGRTVEMPAVIWGDGEPWLGATVYLREKAFEAQATGGSPKTVALHATALSAYATFLELDALAWREFPADRSLRPTYRYRGHLIQRIDQRTLARSTAASHMSVLRAFYSWAAHAGYLHRSAEPFRPRQVMVRYTDAIGLQRVTQVLSSDLAIRRPRVGRRGVEEGCLPLKISVCKEVLRIAEDYFRIEIQLVLKLGFFAGLRLGTILGLTYSGLRQHFRSNESPGCFSISVGPEHGIPSKAGVNYHPSMPQSLLEDLLSYCRSARRDERVAKAAPEHRDLVFLSQRGRPLTTRSYSHDMARLRAMAQQIGLALPRFRFHDARATFGTSFVLAAMEAGHRTNRILPVLMRLMGHSNAASTMSYIDFVEDDARMEATSAAWEDYLGLAGLAQ